MRKLVLGNKLYSSWSLRPWILMRHYGIPFEDVVIPLRYPSTTPQILTYSAAGKVPVLVEEDGTTVWESLAILDHVADTHPDLPVWPRDPRARAFARAIAAEMHAGFTGLRSALPMNLGAVYAHRDRGEAAARDIARVCALWREARERFGAGGPFLFGADFSAADAMYAPVVTRLETYSVPVDAVVRSYMDEVLALPAFREWRDAALREPWTIEADVVPEAPIRNLRQVPA